MRFYLTNSHYDGPMGRIIFIALVLAAGVDAYMFDGKYLNHAAMMVATILRHFGM